MDAKLEPELEGQNSKIEVRPDCDSDWMAAFRPQMFNSLSNSEAVKAVKQFN